jgi:hypothetical protein
MDSLYKLDYEDIIAGMPCRFKYKSVDKEAYGLETDDILQADDKALNKFVGLKKLATYYRKREGLDDASKWSKKRKRLREEYRERNTPKEDGEAATEADADAPTAAGDDSAEPQAKKTKKERKAEAEAEADSKKKKTRRKKKGGETPQLINKFTVASGEADQAASSSRTKASGSGDGEKDVTKKKKKKEPKEVDGKKRRMDLYN